MKKPAFNDFCEKYCDGLYDPKFSDFHQCTGYKQLKEMVVNNIAPASLEEMKRWENNPTLEELVSSPNIKYLRFLHPLLRPFIVENWEYVKNLEI